MDFFVNIVYGCCIYIVTNKYIFVYIFLNQSSSCFKMYLFFLQCNEVKGSAHMELEGLKRSIRYLENMMHIKIKDLVTDRHSSIKKFMRTEQDKTNHLFDVWHVAKGNYWFFVYLLFAIYRQQYLYKDLNTMYEKLLLFYLFNLKFVQYL